MHSTVVTEVFNQQHLQFTFKTEKVDQMQKKYKGYFICLSKKKFYKKKMMCVQSI